MKLLFTFISICIVTQSWLLKEFYTPQEYRFRYDGSIYSGIGQPRSDIALTRYSCDILLQIIDDRTAVLQLENIQFANDNVKSPIPDFLAINNLEKQELSKMDKEMLELPIGFHFQDGLVSEVTFAEGDYDWSPNIKRSILSMLQLNWRNLTELTPAKSMTLRETTVEGDCEVFYTLDESQITKTLNFKKCRQRMELLYVQRFVSDYPECQDKMVLPQTTYSYRTQDGQLKNVQVESAYSVTVKDTVLLTIQAKARLTLKKVAPIHKAIVFPEGQSQGIEYSSDFDVKVEDFLKRGEEFVENPMGIVPGKIKNIEKIVEKLASFEKPSVESTDYFLRLVQYLRLSSKEELRQIQSIYHKQASDIKILIENALAAAGSKNTIQYILHQEISTARLIQLLKIIHETPFPSEQIAGILLNFLKSDKCQRENNLQQAVWLAYGAVVHGAIGPTREKHAVAESQNFKKRVMNVLKEKWIKANSIYEKVLALKTIANAGIDVSVHLLENIINSKDETVAVRMEAIDALRLLCEQMPRKILKILMPIYADRLERIELRMTALRQLFNAHLELPELVQIVYRMEKDPNPIVASFTHALLSSLSKSPLFSHRKMGESVARLLRASFYRAPLRRFGNYRLSMFDQNTLSGFSLNFGAIFGQNVIPRDVRASFETILGGEWNNYLAQIGFVQQNAETLFNCILEKLGNILYDHPLLREKLMVRIPERGAEEPFFMFFLRYKQMDYAVLPIDENLVTDFVSKFSEEGKINIALGEHSHEFDFTTAGFFFNSLGKIPISLGLPILIYSQQPTIFDFDGKITLECESERVRLHFQAHPCLAILNYHAIQLWVPSFTNGVKNVRSVEASLPIDMEVEITWKDNFEIIFRQQIPQERKTLLRVQSQPISFVHYYDTSNERIFTIKQKTISVSHIEELREERAENVSLGEVNFELTGAKYNQWNLDTLLFGEHLLQIDVIPSTRAPKEVNVNFIIPIYEVVDRMDGPQIEIAGEKIFIDERDLSTAIQQKVKIILHGAEKRKIDLMGECTRESVLCRLEVDVVTERGWKMHSIKELLRTDRLHLHWESKWGINEKNQIRGDSQFGSFRNLTAHVDYQLDKEEKNKLKLFFIGLLLPGMKMEPAENKLNHLEIGIKILDDQQYEVFIETPEINYSGVRSRQCHPTAIFFSLNKL